MIAINHDTFANRKILKYVKKRKIIFCGQTNKKKKNRTSFLKAFLKEKLKVTKSLFLKLLIMYGSKDQKDRFSGYLIIF